MPENNTEDFYAVVGDKKTAVLAVFLIGFGKTVCFFAFATIQLFFA